MQKKFDNVDNEEDFIVEKVTYVQEKQECLDISSRNRIQESHEKEGSIQKIVLIDIGSMF